MSAAYIVRLADAALMRTHRDRDAAERDLASSDPRGRCLAIVTSDTHRPASVDGYTYAVPRDWRATIPPIVVTP